MARSSGSSPRRSASAWRICSIRCWPSTPPSSSRCRTRSRRSTRRCCRASRCASCWPTTRAPARRSWPGLLIKELIARGDLQRCLVVCPGSLAEQWQDELYRRFHLPFEILTNDKLEAARTGNWFLETNLVIARLDKLSRNEDVQAEAPGAGLPLGPRRLRRGAQDVGHVLRRRDQVHQALPARAAALDAHAALPADDGDAAQRQGRGLPALHGAARRRPLRGPLPRRRARGGCLGPDAPHGEGEPAQVRRHAALPGAHRLHGALQALRLPRRSSTRRSPTTCARSSTAPRRSQNDKRAGTVGFALTILQRRLASSPEAIYQSLRRRRERLEKPPARAGAAAAGRRGAPRRSPRQCPRSTPRMSRIWRTRPTTKSRPPRRRSSTRRPRRAPSPS